MIDNTTFGTMKAMYHTFGCKLNFAETSTVARMLAEKGVVRAGAHHSLFGEHACHRRGLGEVELAPEGVVHRLHRSERGVVNHRGGVRYMVQFMYESLNPRK